MAQMKEAQPVVWLGFPVLGTRRKLARVAEHHLVRINLRTASSSLGSPPVASSISA